MCRCCKWITPSVMPSGDAGEMIEAFRIAVEFDIPWNGEDVATMLKRTQDLMPRPESFGVVLEGRSENGCS